MLGPVVNDTYFGKFRQTVLKIQKGSYYSEEMGKERGKIGLSPLACYITGRELWIN